MAILALIHNNTSKIILKMCYCQNADNIKRYNIACLRTEKPFEQLEMNCCNKSDEARS